MLTTFRIVYITNTFFFFFFFFRSTGPINSLCAAVTKTFHNSLSWVSHPTRFVAPSCYMSIFILFLLRFIGSHLCLFLFAFQLFVAWCLFVLRLTKFVISVSSLSYLLHPILHLSRAISSTVVHIFSTKSCLQKPSIFGPFFLLIFYNRISSVMVWPSPCPITIRGLISSKP